MQKSLCRTFGAKVLILAMIVCIYETNKYSFCGIETPFEIQNLFNSGYDQNFIYLLINVLTIFR